MILSHLILWLFLSTYYSSNYIFDLTLGLSKLLGVFERKFKNEKLLEIKHLYKSFDKLDILKDINLDVNEGDVVVIIGPSGSGKSTLLRCINKLETLTKGNILLDGKNIDDSLEFHKKIGMVFQSFNLFENLTVLDNITLAPIKTKTLSEIDAVKRAKELLKMINLESKINEYPRSLSGGEKQRVAIVRSLIMSPEIMLLMSQLQHLILRW